MKSYRQGIIIGLLAGFCYLPASSWAQAGTDQFDGIKRYAELADATYLGEDQARAVVAEQGYELDRFENVAGVEVIYFVATNAATGHQIIAVRGTSNVENAVVDLSLKLLPDERAGIALHQGFAQAAEAVYRALQPALKKDFEISTTGHSLGGAIAVILAMYLDIEDYQLGPIITFGQPKLTNVGGARAFAHLDLTRVVTAQDLVPLVPPLDVMDLRQIDIYWHLGKEIVLLDGDDYAELEGIKSMLRATRVINFNLGPANLELHQMAGYLNLIDGKRKAARLVPYTTGIDLLQIFGQRPTGSP